MIHPILASAAEINRLYLIGSGVTLYLLFLWNKKLVKRIAKWAISIAALAVVFIVLHGFGDRQERQQVERKPLVQSRYYQDPMARVEGPGKSGK